MNIAMMQPTFLPWQGYFELIHKSDVFIFLDDFQFSVQSYHQRNRLFIDKNRADWYTVPVNKKSSYKKQLNETEINENGTWRKKMWKSIKQNYLKTPFFDSISPFIHEWLLSFHSSLAEQNILFIEYVCRAIGLNNLIVRSSSTPSTKKRSDRVLELLREHKATTYYSAKGSFNYMFDEKVFPVPDIEVVFQDYDPKPYTQYQSNTFIPYLSILDSLFNIGFEDTFKLIVNGTKKWIGWDDMASLRIV